MLNTTQLLIDSLSAEVSTLCRCYLLTRSDGVTLGFTDHDQDIVIAGVTYTASVSFNPSNISYTNNLSTDNLSLNGVLTLDNISSTDILAGKYDNAKISIFLIDWENPPTYLNPGGTQQYLPILSNARIGKIEKNNFTFNADVTGRSYYLNQKIGDLTSRNCRHNLGDAKCSIGLSGYTYNHTIVSVSGRHLVIDNPVNIADYYANGFILVNSGINAGQKFEVSGYSPGTISLYEPPFISLSPGDNITAVAGCNKELNTCTSKFNNVVNFGGEPFVPGTDFYFNGTQGQ